MTAAPVLPVGSSEAELPLHVRTAFGVAEQQPVAVGWAGGPAWRCGDVVIRAIADNPGASWSARVLDGLHVEGVRLARPIRASDGRWIVAGWAACRYLDGALEPRYDAVVDAANRLHAATAAVPRPRLLDDRDDLLTRSAAAAFGEVKLPLDAARGGALYAQLAPYRTPVRAASQVVHPELFGAVLFDRAGAPGLIDLVPCWRPKEWAAAVVVVDALAWGEADPSLIQHWDRMAEWSQMLLRAVLHRLALHAQHPDGSAQSLTGLERAAGLVSTLL